MFLPSQPARGVYGPTDCLSKLMGSRFFVKVLADEGYTSWPRVKQKVLP
jgi:hypothetical protein